jgi:hypothetical protein
MIVAGALLLVLVVIAGSVLGTSKETTRAGEHMTRQHQKDSIIELAGGMTLDEGEQMATVALEYEGGDEEQGEDEQEEDEEGGAGA